MIPSLPVSISGRLVMVGERRAVGAVRHLHDVGAVVVRAVRAHEAQVHRLRAGAEQLRERRQRRVRLRVAVLGRLDDRGVEPERDVVHEHVAVHLGEVHRAARRRHRTRRARPRRRRGRSRGRGRDGSSCRPGSPPWGRRARRRCSPRAPATRRHRPCRSRRRRGRSRLVPDRACRRRVGARPARCPALRHSSARWNFSAFPPPDFRFMISTPCSAAGTGVPVVALLLSVRTSHESAYRASATATTRRASRHTTDHSADSETTTAATNATAAMPNATATMRVVPARVSAYHTAITITTSSANTAITGPTGRSPARRWRSPPRRRAAIDRIAATRRGSAGFELVVAIRTRPPPPPAPQDPTPRPRPRHRSGAGLPWDDTIASRAGRSP